MPDLNQEGGREAVQACDALRAPVEAFTVDPRYAFRSGMTFETHWQDIVAFALHDGVPGVVRVHFETARNLLLYSWFVFHFHQAAEMHAYSSVEYALRKRARLGTREFGPGLRGLLERAVSEGWIRDDGFRHVRRIAEQRARDNQESALIGGEPDSPESQTLQSYVQILGDVLPALRNKLAHGSAMMSPTGKRTLAICCDLINQLFPKRNEHG
ncbi:MAG TPA: hypothetical protein VJY35_00910 [Candidatus Eisenbacteria bacterium]|nr:hypothetical protein [Candidatus Eisenbacteria bacterium]